MLEFELLRTEGLARRGRLTLHHGVVQTPILEFWWPAWV